jgi:hypothetical protein
MEVQEMNEVIARFMGWKKCSKEDNWGRSRINYETWENLNHVGYSNHFFHSSWDWLMPVVEKINNIDNGIFNFTIGKQFGIIEYTAIQIFSDTGAQRYNFQAQADTTIKAVHFTAWEFITWHNKNSKPKTNE